ncbi:MAG: hypothetical protein EXX96DRAFT_588320 [Benjaminiella poitrasii]|nr:MAG: hypothetical protein EXX96DRAFT_588320 [Benjaminiella poitrasii]
MSNDLGPPPAPQPATMPPMSEADKQRLGMAPSNNHHNHHNHHNGGNGRAPPMMAGVGMPVMANGYPYGGGGVGGMGPNLVFNFSQPHGYALASMPAVVGAEEEVDNKPPKTVLVQGEPTWKNPRRVARKGQPLKSEPCIIQ